jgi:hypothetical protein
MTTIKKLSTAITGAVIIALGTGTSAQARLMVNSQSAVANLDTQQAIFTINFNEVPDFFSVDEFGRQADAFQYFIDGDGNFPFSLGNPVYSELETIIRGGEINIAGDIRVRDVFGVGGPNSGGWGPIRGSVPYTLNGTQLTFSTPLELIGDDDGLFSYELLITEFGSTTDRLTAQSVPEPLTILGSGVALGIGALMKKRYSKR